MTAAFVLRESKRLSFLINTRLHTGTEAHVIIQSKVICKNASKYAAIALNRKGEERNKYVHEQGGGTVKPERISVSTLTRKS